MTYGPLRIGELFAFTLSNGVWIRRVINLSSNTRLFRLGDVECEIIGIIRGGIKSGNLVEVMPYYRSAYVEVVPAPYYRLGISYEASFMQACNSLHVHRRHVTSF